MNTFPPSPPDDHLISLKACPFCGRPVRMFKDAFSQWRVDCSSSIREQICFFARVNGGTVPRFDRPEEAAAAWNRRADAPADVLSGLTDCPVSAAEDI
jgi:hypothetical protein